MDLVLLIIRLLLAVVFAIAAFAKVVDIRGSARAMAGFGVPERLSTAFSVSLVVAEIVIAAALLFNGYSWFGALGALALLVIFTVSMSWQFAKGRDQDCHCFGQLVKEPVGPASIIRNSLLLCLAIFLVTRGATGQGTEPAALTRDDVVVVLLVFVATLAAIACLSLRRVLANQAGILARLASVETMAFDGGSVRRDEAGTPSEGLPIGAVAPAFEIADAHGDLVSLDYILKPGLPVLMFFISPGCVPCATMHDEFEAWQSELAGKYNLVFVSSGRPAENLEKFGGEPERIILIQKKRELSDAMFARWTPSAVLVSRNGRIASRVAAGDEAIRTLVDWAAETGMSEGSNYFANGVNAGKIGQHLPDRTYEINGDQTITTSSLRGRPTLMAFWGLNCSHCRTMHDDLATWAANRTDGDPELIVFTDSDDLGTDLGGGVVVDPAYEAARELGMAGTPSAVLIDEHGRFASETAIGATQIWALIGRHHAGK